MTAVIYARYSSDNQREESIEGQIRECTAGRKNDPQQREHHAEEPPVHWRIVFPGYRCAGCNSGYCSERPV